MLRASTTTNLLGVEPGQAIFRSPLAGWWPGCFLCCLSLSPSLGVLIGMPKPKVAKGNFDIQKTTLAEAQRWLMSHAEGGALCPTCTQHVQVHHREIHASMAKVLIILHRYFEKESDWLHVSGYLEELSKQLGVAIRGGDWVKLRHWGLIEEKPKAEQKGSPKKTGFWKVTSKGHAFTKLEVKVPRYVMVYNDRPLGFVPGCSEVSIVDCLRGEFSYVDLIAGKYTDIQF